MKGPSVVLCPEITRENALTLIKWLQDDEVIRYLSDSEDISDSIENIITRVQLPVLTHFFNRNGRFYMAYNKKNAPVGFVRLATKGSQTEIVLAIGDRKNWGKHLGQSTIRESLKVAFFDLRSEKIIAKIHKKNIRSLKAFLKTGFKIQQEISGIKIFSITMEEYLKNIRTRAENFSEIYISEIDLKRLQKIIDEEILNYSDFPEVVQDLESEISKAVIVPPQELPEDVITMNSRALLHLDGDEKEISLVYPQEADNSNKVSVLSPIGTAIIGNREGDKIEWELPSGEVTEIHIKEILYQPEAAGDYDL